METNLPDRRSRWFAALALAATVAGAAPRPWNRTGPIPAG